MQPPDNTNRTKYFFHCVLFIELPSVSIVGGTAVKTVPVGGNLTLECQGTGIPQPSVRWDRIDGQLHDDIVIKDNKLYIVKAKASFGGTYRCSVENRVGSVQSQIVIFIQGNHCIHQLSSYESIGHLHDDVTSLPVQECFTTFP